MLYSSFNKLVVLTLPQLPSTNQPIKKNHAVHVFFPWKISVHRGVLYDLNDLGFANDVPTSHTT